MAKYELFVGSFDKTEKAALLRGIFDTAAGEITYTGKMQLPAPAYLTMDTHKDVLYAALETTELNGRYGGGAASIRLTAETMEVISTEYTNGKGPAHILLQDGWLILAMYAEGALVQMKVGEDAVIAPASNLIHHVGKGTNPLRQEKAHPHFAAASPDGKYIALCDLGLDTVFLYPFSKEEGIRLEPKRIPVPAGYGPRHLVFSPDGTKIYVMTEMQEHVLVYDYAPDGEIVLLQDIGALPDDFSGESSGAAIRLSGDGKTLVVSNRGHDSLTFFRIKEDQTLCVEGWVSTGDHPRDFVFSPDGRWILCANQNDNTITVYEYKEDRSLPFTERVIRRDDLTRNAETLPCAILFGKEL